MRGSGEGRDGDLGGRRGAVFDAIVDVLEDCALFTLRVNCHPSSGVVGQALYCERLVQNAVHLIHGVP